MKTLILSILVVLVMTISAHADEGMVDVKSSFGMKETGDRLETGECQVLLLFKTVQS